MPFWRGNRYSTGAGSHAQVEQLIRRGREIYIVSPYIDNYYAALIRRHAGRKRFYILSSSMKGNARRILESRGSWASVAVFAASVVVILCILFALSLLSPGIAVLAVLAVLARIAVFKHFSGNRIRLKVPGRFVHAKMYISERMAITGSANLTYNGMHSNIEHMETVYDPRTILELKKQFWKIWDA